MRKHVAFHNTNNAIFEVLFSVLAKGICCEGDFNDTSRKTKEINLELQ